MIEVLASYALNTVQDRGRFGYRNLGVSTAGPMDPLAYRLAVLLCGGEPDSAAIELQTFPFRVKFLSACRFALTGAQCPARLDGREVLPWSAASADADAELMILPPVVGARAYLAVAGGIDVPLVLGSRATDLRAGFGGHEGRSLAPGDRLPIGDAPVASPVARLRRAIALRLPHEVFGMTYRQTGLVREQVIRVLPAAEYDLFDADQRARFLGATWTLSQRSNRTGFRFAADTLIVPPDVTLSSHGLVAGVIQVPPDGEPIVQLADAKTAGGYPKIGCVIEADLWRLAQLQLGRPARFELTDEATALSAEQIQDDFVAETARNLLLASL